MKGRGLLKCDDMSRRRGAVYVAVMTTAFIVSFVGLAGLTAARLHLRSAGNGWDRRQASLLADAAIELAVATLRQDGDWRSREWDFNREYPSPAVQANGGSFTWRMVDLGAGRRRLDGMGRINSAEVFQSVEIGPAASPILSCALLCGDDLRLDGNPLEVLTATGASVCTNDRLRVDGFSVVVANVEAQSRSGSGFVVGTVTIPGEIRPVPPADEVLDYYLSRGTRINTALLGDGSGGLVLSDCVLSPLGNRFGSPNPEGIYIVDCAGKPLRIKRARIVGTLVVLDPGSEGAQIEEQVNWEPAFAHYPALLVRGNLQSKTTDRTIRESVLGVNLNPAGTPWKNQTDAQLDDDYPSAIGGIIYASGDVVCDGLTSNGTTTLNGLLIAGGDIRLTESARLRITYDPVPAGNPPPGFDSVAPNAIIPGTWRRTPSE